MLAVIVCQFKKKNCNPYFIVIMITVLIMNVIFWVVYFKTQNYFVISTTQNVYLSNCTIAGQKKLVGTAKILVLYYRIHEKLVLTAKFCWSKLGYMKMLNINVCHYDSSNLAMLNPTSNVFRLST
jgi:hypothetical protein